jgi:SSS family solute:Na+ symporter/sodium/pantothenate symporter
VVAGILSVAVNWKPVDYLQALIVFSTSGAAATFLVPALMACYWRRATASGVSAGLLAGALTVLLLYLTGIFGWMPKQAIGNATSFRPYFLYGLDPMLWGVLASTVAAVMVSLLTAAPDKERIATLFGPEPKR